MHVQIPTEKAWQRAPRYALTGVWNVAPPALGCCEKCSAGLGALGQSETLTPEQAVQQAIQGESSPDFQSASYLAAVAADVSAGQIPASQFSPNCVAAAAPNLNLFSTASGLALSTASVGTGIATQTGAITAAVSTTLGVVTMGIGVLISVIGMIFAHHAAAVKQEQQLGCAAINAFNNAIQVIDSAVAAGQTTPAVAESALDTVLSQATSYMSASIKHNPCNADCEQSVIMKAIVLYRQSIYANMAAQEAAAASSSASGTSVATGAGTVSTPAAAPSWGWLAAAAVIGVFFIFR